MELLVSYLVMGTNKSAEKGGRGSQVRGNTVERSARIINFVCVCVCVCKLISSDISVSIKHTLCANNYVLTSTLLWMSLLMHMCMIQCWKQLP